MYKLISIYIIILSQGLSLIGSRITGISLGLYIFSKTGNTFPLLLVAFFNELPGMLMGSFSGVVIDRFKRKYILILSDTGQALGTLILLMSLFLNKFQLWHLYTVVLFQGFFGMFQQPALDASVTMLVPQEFRDKINGIRQMTYPLAGIIAPAITGALYPFIGIKGAMIIDFGTFLIGISIISLIQIPEPQSTREGNLYNGSVIFESFSGFKYLFKHRKLLIFVFYFSIINFLLNGPLEVVLPYLIKVTESESLAGSLLSLMSLGAFIGAGLVSLVKFKEKRVLAILVGYAATGIMMISFGMFRNPIGLSLSLLILMIPLPAAGALFTSIMQLKTPPDIQGRVFSAFSQLLFLGTPLSFFLTGWLVDKILEPSIAASHWRVLTPVFGSRAGSGIGFLISLAGLLILILTIVVYMNPSLKEIEKRLPDYEALEKKL